jgi:D-3-phosphoglycerate dehydrogenase / 2-oxoglutarate reductase
MLNILIADEMHHSLFEMLDEIGVKYTYSPTIKREELLQKLKDYDGLIIRSKTPVNKELIDQAPKLKFVGRAGAGLDLIDLQYAETKNIAVFAANEGNKDAVAEHVVGMILCLFNNLNLANNEVKSGIWNREQNRGIELKGKTVGIIGYGNNGSATAKRLSGFDVKVLAYDKYQKNFSDNFATEASMEEIFEQCDIVSLHIPLTDSTDKMVNQSFLNKFTKNIYLINASRGEIVVLNDLLTGLQSGHVLGACLDVLENEKLDKLTLDQKNTFEGLIKLPNTLFTPHIAGWTHESYVKINEVIVSKIRNYIIKGE